MAFKTEDQMYNAWSALGGTYKEFSQSAEMQRFGSTVVKLGTDKFGKTRQSDVASGICRALSLRFIECRLTGISDIEELMETLQGTFGITMIQQGMYKIGLKDEKTAGGVKGVKSGGYNLLTRAVNSREELCKEVISDKQLFIYSFGGSGGGHSVAFDTTDSFYFFDPNFGIFFCPNMSEKLFLSWFSDFWTFPCMGGGESYKSLFHKGRRHLIRFGAAGFRWQLNPVFVSPGKGNLLSTN